MTYTTPWERLTEAAIGYADASDDDAAFSRAKDRLRKASLVYATSCQGARCHRSRRAYVSVEQLWLPWRTE